MRGTPARICAAAILTAAILPASSLSAVAMGSASHLLTPTIYHDPGRIVLPLRDSATLSPHVRRWLRRRGLSYIIPFVPAGFPPVKPLTAERVAVAHTPVGPSPIIQELALIFPLTAISPLRAHEIYWAIAIRPRRGPKGLYYVAFVATRTPTALGSLRHAAG
jgi:hypothetical protein